MHVALVLISVDETHRVARVKVVEKHVRSENPHDLRP